VVVAKLAPVALTLAGALFYAGDVAYRWSQLRAASIPTHPVPIVGMSPPLIEDVNGDGRLDLVVGSAAGMGDVVPVVLMQLPGRRFEQSKRTPASVPAGDGVPSAAGSTTSPPVPTGLAPAGTGAGAAAAPAAGPAPAGSACSYPSPGAAPCAASSLPANWSRVMVRSLPGALDVTGDGLVDDVVTVIRESATSSSIKVEMRVGQRDGTFGPLRPVRILDWRGRLVHELTRSIVIGPNAALRGVFPRARFDYPNVTRAADLVVTGQLGPAVGPSLAWTRQASRFIVLRNDGHGTFRVGAMFRHPPDLSMDINGDGRQDPVLRSDASTPLPWNPIRVPGRSGPGSLVTPTPDGGLLLQDLNGDGRADATYVANGAILTRRGLPTGLFGAPVRLQGVRLSGPGPWYLRAGDITGDGRTDLVASHEVPSALYNLRSRSAVDRYVILQARGDDRLAQLGPVRSAGTSGFLWKIRDMDGDGRADLVFLQGWANPSIAWSNGDGTFR
jgi:hypothetical protein